MNFNPTVSIIVPCYNYARFLSDAIESIIDQNYSDWECLIVDDGSTDNTRSVAEFYAENDKRIRYFYQDNHGLSASRNKGLKFAKGRFIQFLDADDMIESCKIKVQVEFLESHPEVDIVYGRTIFFENNQSIKIFEKLNNLLKYQTSKPSGVGESIVLEFVRGNFITVNSSLFRFSLIENIGYFNEVLDAFEDWDFWVRAAISNKSFQFLKSEKKNYDCCLVREHPFSMSKNRLLMLRSGLKLRHSLDLSKYSKDIFLLNQEKLRRLEANIGIELIRSGQLKNGTMQYVSALRRSSSKGIIILYLFRFFLSEKWITFINLLFKSLRKTK